MLKANYGRHDPDCVAAVKALYGELKLEARFKALEEETYARLCTKISSATASGEVPPEVYLSLLHKIYRRSK